MITEPPIPLKPQSIPTKFPGEDRLEMKALAGNIGLTVSSLIRLAVRAGLPIVRAKFSTLGSLDNAKPNPTQVQSETARAYALAIKADRTADETRWLADYTRRQCEAVNAPTATT